MGARLSFFNKLHTATQRDYVGRMTDDKVACMKRAREYGADFWDGDRRFGYGGYKYDGRWATVAGDIVDHYQLKSDAKILDVGCGKAFLLYELQQLLPGAEVCGFDISAYAVANAKEEVRDRLFVHKAEDAYPYKDNAFDLVISLNTLHNLKIFDLKKSFAEIQRVGKQGYICVEAYRNEDELFALQCWALTAESFFSDDEWTWLYEEFGYSGDYEFIHF